MVGTERHKLHVRQGDLVQIVTGNARGVRGRILRAMPRKGKVVVEGANMVWKHLPKSRLHPQGGRIQVEAPLDASNVMLICPNRNCDRADRPVRARAKTVGGRRLRVCVRCGTEIAKAE